MGINQFATEACKYQSGLRYDKVHVVEYQYNEISLALIVRMLKFS